jgi:NAD-dependent deacetylase sirtuin 2
VPTTNSLVDYFLRNPDPFYELSRELFPGSYKPTHSHHFIRLLEERNWLLRNYSQNIDMLERIANVSDDKIVEAHGSFHTASCVGSAIKHADPNQDDTKGSKDDSDDDDDDNGRIERIPGCGKKYSLEEFKTLIFNKDKGGIPRCDACSGLIKPDIVFFGEQLPDRFHSLIGKDFRDADALIVMGTSLQVMPFASLINSVRKNVPRLLINMEEVGVRFSSSHGFDFSGRFQKYRRDAFYKGTTDEGVKLFCKLMGEDWCDSLEKLVAAKDAKVDNLGLKKEEEVVLDKAAEDDLTSAFSNVKL